MINYKQNTHSFTLPVYPYFSLPNTPKARKSHLPKTLFFLPATGRKGLFFPKRRLFRITRRLIAIARQLMAGRTVVVGTGTVVIGTRTVVIAIATVLVRNENGRNYQRGRSQWQLGRSSGKRKAGTKKAYVYIDAGYRLSEIAELCNRPFFRPLPLIGFLHALLAEFSFSSLSASKKKQQTNAT